MKHARPHTSATNWQMSTTNRGSILPADRMGTAGAMDDEGGLMARNAFDEPGDYPLGPNGRVGGNDPHNMADGGDDQVPFRSEAQRRYLWSQHPDIAEAWAHGEHTSSGDHKMPSREGGDRKMIRARKHRGGRKHGRKGR